MHLAFAECQVRVKFKLVTHVLDYLTHRKAKAASKIELLDQRPMLILDDADHSISDIIHRTKVPHLRSGCQPEFPALDRGVEDERKQALSAVVKSQ